MTEPDETTYSTVRTVLGGTRRDACWHLTDEVDVLTVLGRAIFDLRTVETTGAEVVEISVTCAFGFVDFIVPDGTMVVLDGTSFLAGARSDVAGDGDHKGPRIEITALTVLGRTRVFSPGAAGAKLENPAPAVPTEDVAAAPAEDVAAAPVEDVAAAPAEDSEIVDAGSNATTGTTDEEAACDLAATA